MGVRIIKTAVAAVIAIYLAEWLTLDFALGAGLLAILGVDVTRKRSLNSAAQRIGASLAGMLLALGLFYFLGFHIWVFGVYICIAYPILSMVKLKDGIVTSSVIVLHVLQINELQVQVVWNEVQLLLIGFGAATLINVGYMPNSERKLGQARTDLENLFSEIFLQISHHLNNPNHIWSGKEYIDAEKVLDKGRMLAEQSAENRLFRGEELWSDYFSMRQRQSDSIGRMLYLVAHIFENLPLGEEVARLFVKLSKDVKEEYYTGDVLRELALLEGRFREMALPATREEFEIRSAILQLCLELKYYLEIAEKEKKKK